MVRSPAASAAAGGFRGVLYEIVPLTVGASAAYTIVHSVVRDARGVGDWVNEFAGGAAAGALVAGIKRRSVNGGVGGALVFGCAAASGSWYGLLEGSANKERGVDARSVAITTADMGASASASTGLQRRLV